MSETSTSAVLAKPDSSTKDSECSDLTSISTLSPREIRPLFEAGRAPRPSAMFGSEFRGVNFSPVARLFGFERFIKGFDSTDDSLSHSVADGIIGMGYNRFVAQRPDDAWCPKSHRRHGYFLLRSPHSGEVEGLSGPSNEDSTVIDYSASRENHRLNPERCIRDYLVSVSGDGGPPFIGAAFVGWGRNRVFSNFFCLDSIEGES